MRNHLRLIDRHATGSSQAVGAHRAAQSGDDRRVRSAARVIIAPIEMRA
jgi:hypothetical protein